MKKLFKSVMMLSIVSLAILSSCSKEDDNAAVTDVKIEVSALPASPVEGDSIKITVVSNGTSDNKLKSISITRSVPTDATLLSKSLNATTSTDVVSDKTTGAGTYTYTIIVTGEKGTPASKTVSVVVRATPKPIDFTSGKIDLYSPGNSDAGTASFMQLIDPYAQYTRVRSEFIANVANVDLGFYFGTNDKATLASPTDANLQSVNDAPGDIFDNPKPSGVRDTKLSKTTWGLADFDAIQASGNDSALTAMAAATTDWTSRITALAKNDVLLFKTKDNKLGVVLVENISGTNGAEAIISVKVISQ